MSIKQSYAPTADIQQSFPQKHKVAQTLRLLLRLLLAFFVMWLAYIAGTLIIGQIDIALTPEEAQQANRSLLFVCLVNALLLSYLIVRSPWHGLKLIGAVFLVQFGVETFMTQIETLYFNSAVQIESAELAGLVVAGAVRALIFAPLAVAIFGKLRKPAHADLRCAPLPSMWGLRLAILALFYFVVYFTFGYFVAWQWEETRLFYTGSTTIQPLVTHFEGLFLSDDPLIIPFQLLRGTLWAALAFLICRMSAVRRWQASLITALVFSLLLALPLGLFPNPYMPPAVVTSHFVEILLSMLLFGSVAGWVMWRRVDIQS